MELNDNTFDIIEGGVTLPDCFATVNTATAQSQEPAAVESSAAATPQQHMQLDTEEQGSAAEKDYSSSRLSFGSNVGSSSFESFINNEDVQDSDTLVTVPSQPGPTSSVGQEQLDGHEGGLPSGPTSNVGQGQHGGHEGGLPSGPSSSVGQEQPGGGEELLPSGPSSSVGAGTTWWWNNLVVVRNCCLQAPAAVWGRNSLVAMREGCLQTTASVWGRDSLVVVRNGCLQAPSSSVAEKQQLPSSPCSSVGQGQLDSDKEEVPTGLSSSVEQEQQASPGHSSSVAEKQQLPSSPCSSVGQSQLDSDEDLPCLTVPSQELPLSEKNTKARRKENHKCPTCHLSLPSAFSLLLHRRQHNGQEHFHCSSCDFRNPFRQNLEAHVRKKHSRKLKDTEKKRKRAASVSPGVKEAPVKKVKENIPKNKRKLVRQSKRVKK
ncbi:hypothetical protein O3P69_005590 [Scylla paramamosain]|uniref:C2H2-type domain-containing protein n=1 Tax=Scylla paramamosain TaxID=85552 RepID=A0AAW0U9I0_SCYPA